MYCIKKTANIFRHNLPAFNDVRQKGKRKKGNKITPTTIQNSQSNINNVTTSLSTSSPVTSVQSQADQADHISFTEDHDEEETYLQEIKRTEKHTDELIDGTRHMDPSEDVISETRLGDLLRLVGTNQELSNTSFSSEGPSESEGPPQSEGPTQREFPPKNKGHPQNEGPQKSEDPPHHEGPPPNDGPPKSEGPSESEGTPQSEGPQQTEGPSQNESPPSSGSPPYSENHSFTPAHLTVVRPYIEKWKDLKNPKLLVMDQPLVAFKYFPNPNFPDLKNIKLLISELFYDEEYVEHEIEQMIQRLSESNFFENKETKINIEKIIDPASALLLLEYYGEDSRIITILRKYFNF